MSKGFGTLDRRIGSEISNLALAFTVLPIFLDQVRYNQSGSFEVLRFLGKGIEKRNVSRHATLADKN